jgi:DNA-binding response OmpR family regulator
MARRILLVDDEVAVLLTMKAILEISGFEVDTAASAREGQSKLHTHEYHMVITDMRMESDAAGHEVIVTARKASYHPAVALLTAFPVDEADWQEMGAHQLLLKPVHTRVLLEQIEQLFASHAARLARMGAPSAPVKVASAKKTMTKKAVIKKTPAKKAALKKATARKVVAKKAVTAIKAAAPGKKSTKKSAPTSKAAKTITKPAKKAAKSARRK